jgi:diaminopimelate epimerase
LNAFEFTKAQALGNDFIIVDDRDDNLGEFSKAEIVRLCDRRKGIGADGILLLKPSSTGVFRMRTLNSDGSEAEMCGNGVRCAARYAFDNDISRERQITVETAAGLIVVEIVGNDKDGLSFKVDLGAPRAIETGRSVAIDGRELEFTHVSMGNPHAVLIVKRPEDLKIDYLGPAIENDPQFPNKTNVEFAKVVEQNLIQMRVWERGAGETQACGTGAAATLVAAVTRNLTGRRCVLALAGGELDVEWLDSGNVTIQGPAEIVFTGRTERRETLDG